jgi:transposase
MKDEQLENSIIHLHTRGWSTRSLAVEFNISRGRIRRIIEGNTRRRCGDIPDGEERVKRASKLDSYREQIHNLIETYKDPVITNRRVYELIKEKGYEGGMTILCNYLAGARGKKLHEPITCVETLAGQRGSHDWMEHYILFTKTGKKEKVTFFSFILNYSRRQYIRVVEDKTQATLLNCLIDAFIYFDGVPREIKSDNQKACVDHWEQGRPVFNVKYLAFATHYRFIPLTIHPGKPMENLKIERPFYYLQTNFLNARSFYDAGDVQDKLVSWLERENDRRIHRTLRRSPIEAYQEELPYLQALPRSHFETSHLEYRIVNNESCITWQGYYYHVPREYLYETCPVRIAEGHIIIYSPGGKEVAHYPLAEKGRKDRYIGRTPAQGNGKMYLQSKDVIERLRVFGPVMEEYIREVKKHKSGSYQHHLRCVLRLKVNYHAEDIILAVRRALKYKVYESGAIENFLLVNAQKKNEVKLLPKNDHDER